MPAERRRALRFILLCALLGSLLAPLQARADAAYAPPFPILDLAGPTPLGLFTAWHEDPQGNLDFEQVTHLPPERFTVSEQESLHFGYTRSTYWFRVALQNTLDGDLPLLLEVPHPSLTTITLFRPTGNAYTAVHAGSGSARVIGDLDHNGFLFSIYVPAGETQVLWFRVRSELATDFSLVAHAPEAFGMQQGTARIVTGIFLGVMLALAAAVAMAWFGGQRRAHGWYLLTLLSVVVFLLAREGYAGILLLRQSGLQPLLEAGAALVATLASLQFARLFLDTRHMLPRLDRLLCGLLVAGVACLLATPWLDAHHLGPLYTSLAALCMPATLLAALLLWRRHPAGDAPLYFTARLASALTGSLVVAGDWGLFDRPQPAGTLLILGATIEALLIAWLLFRRERQERIAAFAERIGRATRQAEQQARADVLDRFSHDARAPLNGMLGMTELLIDTSLTPRQREYLLTIRSAGENLLTLLNDTLDWSRLDTGQLELQHTDFDMAQLVADSMETVQLRAEEKHVELVVDIDPSLPSHVNGDPARLRQVLCNLLANAVRSTNRGEVHVQVSPAGTAPLVRIEVRDTGVGIARERLATLFERGPGQGDNAHHQGLGLVIARQLVERMGGEIGVQSEERRGSIFWFTLPLPEATEQGFVADTAILSGKRLLAVDDNAAMRRILETQATQWGMQVTVADNGQEALAIARSQANLGEPFDAVIVDHNMPGMSGLQLAARIKEDPLIRNDAVIVMLTGLNIAPTETMARNVGIRRVLTKPVAGRTLRTALAEEFARRESFEPADGSAVQPLPERLRVLVVEDNQMSQKVIRGMLAKLGVRSDIAGNGQEAVDAVQHHRYDLVLMDCEMPVVNGYDATRRIRAWERDNGKPHTPIIALSAYIMQEMKERCREAGMDAHMAKPVDLNELRETLRIYTGD